MCVLISVVCVANKNMDSLLQFNQLSDYTDSNNNNTDDYRAITSIKEDKYSLRPRSLRRLTETNYDKTDNNNLKSNKIHKTKQKPAPLSKYRRKTANARERNRMREINQAFEALRRVIPHMQTTPILPGSGNNEKLTKITTLRLAMKYISTLSAALNNPDPTTIDSLSDYNDLDCLLLESDGESLPLSDNSFLASPDFPETSLSPVDFSDPCLPALLHTDFTEHALETSDFNDFLLT